MKTFRHTLIMVCFILPLTSLAIEPLDTQLTSGGHEVQLVKTTLKDGIFTAYIRIENKTADTISIKQFDVKETQYIAGGRRYPLLQDAEDNWIVSPFGSYELFSQYDQKKLYLNPAESIVGWMKFEAPPEDQWPIELNLPQTLPFFINKPE